MVSCALTLRDGSFSQTLMLLNLNIVMDLIGTVPAATASTVGVPSWKMAICPLKYHRPDCHLPSNPTTSQLLVGRLRSVSVRHLTRAAGPSDALTGSGASLEGHHNPPPSLLLVEQTFL